MALGRRKSRTRSALRAERVTAGLAVIAAATAGTVLVGEIVRLARRRLRHAESPDDVVSATGLATRDALRVARQAYVRAPHHEVVLFNILTGFVGAFATIRLITAGIRKGRLPQRYIAIGDLHVHHFVPGILIAFVAGGAGILTSNDRLESAFAIPFGVGMGLTFDEAALLLDLRDVYWSREGLLSVQISLAIAATLGGTILALRMIGRGERGSEEEGLIPHLAPEA
jgi:hypothetical protein